MITKEDFVKGQKVMLTVRYSGDDEDVKHYLKGVVANVGPDSIEMDLTDQDGYACELQYWEILEIQPEEITFEQLKTLAPEFIKFEQIDGWVFARVYDLDNIQIASYKFESAALLYEYLTERGFLE